ncbi:unnamed protein product [Rotaria sp. Silwood1]|nr:unnamed protein product [Rotaria sp. Silwood1]CAF3719659.1 unnamed protein product [Rotaria sp. Silwood1]CAF4678025.1 unnamed protein product [Rotaria sp. Silwood1]
MQTENKKNNLVDNNIGGATNRRSNIELINQTTNNHVVDKYICGTRVVRGPDWKYGKQDGGEGHVGTVKAFENENDNEQQEVIVIWDHGEVGRHYRCQTQFDLRVLDNSATGICHDNSVCSGCGQTPIYGIRWHCGDCPNVDLCSMCYHSDRHNTRHRFCRIVTPHGEKILIDPRRKAKKLAFRGLYPGAKVARGPDWSYGDQDSGEKKHGKIIEIQDWSKTHPRSAAYVVWDNDRENLYRVGFNGMVDLRSVTPGKGGYYYPEHAPLLGETYYSREHLSSGLTSEISQQFQVGDYVNIDLELEIVQSLQHGHGGWTDNMFECLGTTGMVQSLDEDHDVVVVYPSGNRWTLNPALLTRVELTPEQQTAMQRQQTAANMARTTASSMPNQALKVNDMVQICSDLERIKIFQRGHGEWAEAMVPALGKIGRAVHLYADGDVKVQVGGGCWIFNPLAVTKVDSTQTTEDGHEERLNAMLKKLFSAQITGDVHEELVKAAANGDTRRVEELIKQTNVDVNGIFAGHTPLQAAAQNGHLDIIRLLIQHHANLEIEDKDGDRAVHHAAFGDEAEVLELLAKSGADLNARNKRRQTALHIGVCKGHFDVCKTLLSNGAHPGIQDSDGDTPLHDAISKRRDDLIIILLEYNADVATCNNNGFNSIHHAALRGNSSAIELILSKIQNRQWLVDEKKDDGFTALHLSALNDHCLVAELLLTKGNASINAQNISLQTALHLAVGRQHLQIVNLLCSKNANVNLADKDGDTCLHEALRHHTLSQLKQLQDVGDSGRLINIFTNTNGYDKRPSVAIACTLVMHGADLSAKNKKNQKPFDLCPDPHLCRILTEKHIEYNRENNNDQQLSQNNSLTECLVCSDNERDTLFQPCSHVVTCHLCASRVKKCLLCKENIQTRIKIEQCKLCSQRKASVMYKPCGHLIACEECAGLTEKCFVCRVAIDSIVSFNELCCGNNDSVSIKSETPTTPTPTPSNDVSDAIALARLQQQLQEIREQVHCPICMDRLKNMVFLCGHGVCQNCGDRVQECPICRKPIEKSIILYT